MKQEPRVTLSKSPGSSFASLKEGALKNEAVRGWAAQQSFPTGQCGGSKSAMGAETEGRDKGRDQTILEFRGSEDADDHRQRKRRGDRDCTGVWGTHSPPALATVLGLQTSLPHIALTLFYNKAGIKDIKKKNSITKTGFGG